MLLERINMDYSLNYYSARSDYYFPINVSSFFLFYDYENPFNPPFFREMKLPSDYVKIWEFPYMDAFWKYNYFLPENKKKEERLLFFEKNGIVKNKDDSPFKPNIEELKSPLQAWSKERVDIEKTTINSLFSGLDDYAYSAPDVIDLKNNSKEIEKIYSEEMKVLGNNIRLFKNGTNNATEIYTLINWWNTINDSLNIENSPTLLTKPTPNLPYMFDKDEIKLVPAYFYNTGTVLLQLDQYEDAARYFTKTIEKININKDPSRMAHLYFKRAEAYYRLGWMNLFCSDLQKAIALDKSIKEYVREVDLKHCESE